MSQSERRLAAIMFTDIVGYTALTQQKESAALQILEEHRELLRPIFTKHRGREVKTIGDAFLVEFGSALEATLCAVDVQNSVHSMNLERGGKLQVRIGIHLGDVVHQGDDVLGDAVNISSRIYPLAEPGGICVSEQVYDQVKNKLELPLVSLGEKSLKNVAGGVEVFRVVMPWEQQPLTKEEIVLPRDRIAILPFASFSSDPDDAYFADGVTDEIISAVAGISGLSVISRTSVIGYKGTTKKVGEIGRELNVGSVLEGTFKKAGNKIRVTTQLIDVTQDRHLWAQNYDRNLDDVFEVQSDVAKQVADALRVKILSPEKERIERKPTESTTAYALYLKGRFFWNKRGVENVKKASEYFELAVHEDPSFALGYVGQADCSLILVNWGIDIETNMLKAKVMATKAIEVDPGLAEALTTIAMVLADEHDLRQAEIHYKRAIQLKSSYATAHQWYSTLLVDQLRWGEALEQIEKAVELDPLSPVINYNLGVYYYAKREYSRAIELFKRVIELDPSYPPVHVELFFTHGMMKMFDDVKREATTVVELLKGTYPAIQEWVDCFVARYEDDKETIRRLVPDLEARINEPGHMASSLASLYFYLGENDKGFRLMELAYSKGEDLSGIKWDPDLDHVRTDPRYLDLLKRLGLL